VVVSRSSNRKSRETAPPVVAPPSQQRLIQLLKHAHLALGDTTGRALAPFQITGRELAVLVALDAHEPLSQQQAAGQLGVDRTTMVELIDGLEQKHLVERRPDTSDRRRNIVQLTADGQHALREGGRAALEAERQFLAHLNPAEATQLTTTLQRLLTPPADGPV
jgi:DNA-binding MarR family transcriptional regulator